MSTSPDYQLHPSDYVGKPLIGMIWAQTVDGVIGRDGQMPWHLPEDLAHFRRTTQGHPVIMGRRTWESFPEKYRPLPGRTNIVVTRQHPAPSAFEGAVVVHSLDEALAEARRSEGADEIWIIGGGQIYAEAAPQANAAVVTVIDVSVEGDTFAPGLGNSWKLSGVAPAEGWSTSESGTRYRIGLWTRIGDEV
ncbi:dihydrofolate reductase [Arthrobacter sp. JZ12]|uniref:dihydrofolate reductase n=1 Tax=Arthrobacter sp. JZ12 TaxID=2654190 RepID=UPI002B48C2BA|nr:dihydrofolate reductase [Arthrobacter sp. JZ12]WRH25636.1 dihydrofolate reductase [Arthrobacter sp. JZ12]